MRIAIISAAIMAAISFTASAADLSQAQANYQHADRMSSSTHASINSVAWQNGDGRATKQAESTAKAFGAARAQAAADLKSAEMHAASAANPAPQRVSVSKGSWLTNANLARTASLHVVATPAARPTPSVTGTSYRGAVASLQQKQIATTTAPPAPQKPTPAAPQPVAQAVQKAPPAPAAPAVAAPVAKTPVAIAQATPPTPAAPAAVAVAAPQPIAQATTQKAPPTPAAPAPAAVAAPQITGTTYRAAVVADQTAALAVKAPALPAQKTTIPATALTPATPAPAPKPAAPVADPTPAPVQPKAIVDKPTNSEINVAASSLDPKTPVQTPQGVVTAGSLPPETQVSLPIDSVFHGPAKKGGHDRNDRSTTRGGTGNGGQNAANSRSGMAHGFGDNHVGGGHAQSGSKNVGHW